MNNLSVQLWSCSDFLPSQATIDNVGLNMQLTALNVSGVMRVA